MKWSYLPYMVLVLLLLIVGYGIFSLNSEKGFIPQKTNFPTMSTGSTAAGDVEIALTPRGLENGKFLVGFSATTHSVELSTYDLLQIITLSYDEIQVQPTSAPTMEGHHSSGTLLFDIPIAPKKFTIEIKDIPNVPNREFVWG